MLLKTGTIRRTKTTPDKVLSKTKKRAWWLCNKGHSWSCPIGNRTGSRSGCPYCASNGTSKAEQELISFIKSVVPGENVIVRDRQLLLSIHRELDVYIPSLQVAVEFNGLYWHSEQAGRDKDYHYNKWAACKDKGVRLITIWEDDWRDKPDVVRSFLLSALKPEDSTNNNLINSVEDSEARDFIASKCLSSLTVSDTDIKLKYIGSYNTNGTINSLLSYIIDDSNCYIYLYGDSSCFKPLVEYVISVCRNSNVSTITAYSDNDISNESVYEENGFLLKNDHVRNYWIVNPFDDCRRYHSLDHVLSDSDFLFKGVKNTDDLAVLDKVWTIHGSGLSKWILYL